MKDLTQYHFKLMEAFFDFLKTGDEEKLASVWNEVDQHARTELGDEDPENGLWIRFFHGDTAATTLNDIRKDYHDSNRNYLLECMQICVDSGEIEVYFS